MYKKEIDAIKEAERLANYHGLPFVITQNECGFSCHYIGVIDIIGEKIMGVMLSDGSFQRLGSDVIHNVKKD